MHFCMNQIHIATLLLSVALLSLSQLEYRAPSPLAHLPDPAMAMPSSAVTFSNFVCCGCYDRGPGSRSTSTFSSYKAVTTHIGSSTCQPGLSLCSTDHRGGPRIMRQDLWALQGHGQCDPPQTPAQVLVEKSHATSYYYIVCFLRF